MERRERVAWAEAEKLGGSQTLKIKLKRSQCWGAERPPCGWYKAIEGIYQVVALTNFNWRWIILKHGGGEGEEQIGYRDYLKSLSKRWQEPE